VNPLFFEILKFVSRGGDACARDTHEKKIEFDGKGDGRDEDMSFRVRKN